MTGRRGPSHEDEEEHPASAMRDGDRGERDLAGPGWFDTSNLVSGGLTGSVAPLAVAYRLSGVVRSSWSDAPVWLRILWSAVWAVVGTAVALSIAGSAVLAGAIGVAIGVVGYLATLRLIRIAYPPGPRKP